MDKPSKRDELKLEVIESLRPYVGQNVTCELRGIMCSTVHQVLLGAYADGRLKEEPRDINVTFAQFSHTAFITIMGQYLSEWIDDNWATRGEDFVMFSTDLKL